MMHIKTIAKVIIFISLGLFLASRLLNGTLSFYIHPRFNILTALTAIGLVAVGIVYARQHLQHLLSNKSEHDEHYLDQDSHHHDHDHDHNLSWLGLAILAVPVILGLLVQPRPLGADALQNREVNVGSITSAQAPESSKMAVAAADGERNILDWLYLFQGSSDLTEFNDEDARVIGFVYQDERFGSDEFLVSRFTVACCVADAAPIGLPVRWSESPQLKADEWVEVEGTFQVGDFNGYEIPILIAKNVETTKPPAQPYLYE